MNEFSKAILIGDQTSAAVLSLPIRFNDDIVGPGEVETERFYLHHTPGSWTHAALAFVSEQSAASPAFEACLYKFGEQINAIFVGRDDTRNCVVHWVGPQALEEFEEDEPSAAIELLLIQGMATVGSFSTAAPVEETPSDVLADLTSVVDQIRTLEPLAVSDEMRSLAREAANSIAKFPRDKSSIEKWARNLAESVKDADD